MKKLFEKDFFWLALILAVSLLAIFPLFRKGFYSFHDEAHLANLYEMTRAVSTGQIPPRWAPDMSFNFGHPFFNFYYLFPFYLGSFFNLIIGLSLVVSIKLVFLLSVPFSGLAFYWLMRKFFGKVISFSGAVVYMFTPYRAVDIYVRGAVGEMWSFVFMPLVFASFASLIEKRNLKNFLLSSFSLAGLILSHNLTSIIFLPFAAIFCLCLISQKKNKLSFFLSVLGSLFAGLSLSAYYWLPAFLEKKFMRPGTPFYPFDNFPFIKQLLIPSWGYGISQWGIGDGMSFQIGIINLLTVVIALVVLIIRKKLLNDKKKILLTYLFLSFTLSVFLMNIRSWFIWKVIPLGTYIEFPWRLLLLTTFFSSFMVGFLEDLFKKRKSEYFSLILAIMSIILTWNYFKPQNQVFSNDDYYLTRFFIDRNSKGKSNVISKEYFNYGEGHLPLTIWTEKRPSNLPSAKMEINYGTINFKENTPVWYSAVIETKRESQIVFHSYYFPGWKAFVDDKETKIEIGKPLGEIVISVPPGQHNIVIKLVETPIRLVADIISFATFLSFVLLAILKLF